MFCPMCGSPDHIILGNLGGVIQVRCRDCGIDYSKESNKRKRKGKR